MKKRPFHCVYRMKWSFVTLKPNRILKKSIIAIAFLRNKSGTFPLNILQYKFQEDPINNCPNSSKSKFPWTHVLNQPLELMVQHEQFQFQLIESCQRGYKKNNVTVPKAPAPIEVRVTVVLSNTQYR
jgi:hypothetical protein